MTKESTAIKFDYVKRSGTVLEIAGIAIAAIFVFVGVVEFFNGDGLWKAAGAALGILLMIAGYAKRSAEASVAALIVQAEHLRRVTEREVRTE